MMSDIEKAINFYRDKAKEYSIAMSQREYLREFRKSKKAMLMIQAEKGGITAVSKQEVFAYAHPEYIQLLDGIKAAVEQEAYLRHITTAAKLRIEVWRSQEATKRTERHGYGA